MYKKFFLIRIKVCHAEEKTFTNIWEKKDRCRLESNKRQKRINS